MTNTLSALVAALAISATLGAATTPVSALEITRDGRSIGGVASDVGPSRSPGDDLTRANSIANGDLGSGRGGDGVVSGGPISGTDLGSGRIADGPISGTDLGSSR